MQLNCTRTKELLEKALDSELHTSFRYRMLPPLLLLENVIGNTGIY